MIEGGIKKKKKDSDTNVKPRPGKVSRGDSEKKGGIGTSW